MKTDDITPNTDKSTIVPIILNAVQIIFPASPTLEAASSLDLIFVSVSTLVSALFFPLTTSSIVLYGRYGVA